MASLYKKTVYVRDKSTGDTVRSKSKKWWGRYRDANGREKRSPLSIDRAVAQVMLGDLVRRVEREKVGIIEPADEQRMRPVSEHVRDYENYLKSKAITPCHVASTIARVSAIVTGCQIRSIAAASSSDVANWLRIQREQGKFGVSTSNGYLIAAKSFWNWLVREGRVVRNPLAHLKRLNAEPDIRRYRRVLSPEELHRVIKAAECSQRPCQPTGGADRSMLYRLAAFTGLRARELASLTLHSFDLESDPPTVRVEARTSKRRRNDVLPLEARLAERLRSYLGEQSLRDRSENSDARVWPGRWYRKAAVMLRRDMDDARTEWLDEAPSPGERAERAKTDFLRHTDSRGRVVDFHCLRHGFITYLVAANVSPKVTQTLARHSTISLTMDRYTHLEQRALVVALQLLPALDSIEQQ